MNLRICQRKASQSLGNTAAVNKAPDVCDRPAALRLAWVNPLRPRVRLIHRRKPSVSCSLSLSVTSGRFNAGSEFGNVQSLSWGVPDPTRLLRAPPEPNTIFNNDHGNQSYMKSTPRIKDKLASTVFDAVRCFSTSKQSITL